MITLQPLQERHQAMRAQLASLDPVVAGTVTAHELGNLVLVSLSGDE